MIKGMGIDIIEIDRIRRVLARRRGFIKRFFSEEEIEYYESRNLNAASIAGGFAAKEAVAKAMGTGFRDMCWTDIVILHDELGKPLVRMEGRAKDACFQLGIKEILITISHSRDYAVANALAMGGV